MTVIWDGVKARYGTEFLVNLTNPQSPESTTVNDTKGEAAVTDVHGDIRTYCGIDYATWSAAGNDITAIDSVAIDGVIAKLQIRTGAGGTSSTENHNNYIERLKAVAKITGRDRVMPKTGSILVPSSEQRGEAIVRPDFDRRRFDDLIPNAPGEGEDRGGNQIGT